MTVDEACRGINAAEPPGISSLHRSYPGYFYRHQNGAHVAFADGSVRLVPDGISPANLGSLLTRDHTGKINLDELQQPKLNWVKIFALASFFVSTVLLLFRPRGKMEELTAEDVKGALEQWKAEVGKQEE